jgi:hypothetical protein
MLNLHTIVYKKIKSMKNGNESKISMAFSHHQVYNNLKISVSSYELLES